MRRMVIMHLTPNKVYDSTSEIKSTSQSSMSKTLEKNREQLDLKSRQNDIRQSEDYIKEKNTVIR